MTDRTTRLLGLYSVISGIAVLVVSPLLALAYFATKDGAESLGTSTVSYWAEPARDTAGRLLTFASADHVYGTYLQLFALLFPAVLLCALAVKARRPAQAGGLERWGWRVALVGYGLLTIGLIVAFFVEVADHFMETSDSGTSPLNIAFLSLLLPGIVLSSVGSTALGIALVRSSYVPRVTAWLLAFAFPLWIVGSFVLGHNSLGLVPLFVAWAFSGWRFWSAAAGAAAPEVATQPVRG
jgi:hypothetical protein